MESGKLFSLFLSFVLCGIAYSGCPGMSSSYENEFLTPRYEIHNNDCIYFSFHKGADEDAESLCLDDNGHMMSIYSKADNDWLQLQIRDNYGLGSQRMFIGLQKTSSGLKWIDGTAVNYTNFRPNAKDTSYTGDYLCYGMDPATGYWDAIKCNDGSYSAKPKLYWVCQYKNVIKFD